MPNKKENESHRRSTLTRERSQAKDTHYNLIKAIKKSNQENNPIGFKKLCELVDAHVVSRFIREAESWGMIESFVASKEGVEGEGANRVLRVTCVGDAFLEYYEKNAPPEKHVIKVPRSKIQ